MIQHAKTLQTSLLRCSHFLRELEYNKLRARESVTSSALTVDEGSLLAALDADTRTVFVAFCGSLAMSGFPVGTPTTTTAQQGKCRRRAHSRQQTSTK
mmetsp:Transcript_53622/g.110647  ORF Transcript_53622/g.110647 Transcript_53622/m.110647 type:complete len:98 (-) Transcript_53622:7-300(-)